MKIESIRALYKQGGLGTVLYAVLAYLKIDWILLPVALVKIKRYKPKGLFNFFDVIDFGYNMMGGMIRSLQIRPEIVQFLTVIRALNPKVIIEIGTYNGGTLFLFSQTVSRNALIISIDYPDVRFGGGHGSWRNILYKNFAVGYQKIHIINVDSHKAETLRKVEQMLNRSRADFIFIDGDHSYEGVKQDFLMYSPLLKENGIIAFHDIVKHPKETGCEVNRFWNEVKSLPKYESSEIIHDKNQESCGIGILKRKY